MEEGLRAFNVERIHAGDWTTGDRLAGGVAGLVAAVRTLPMMAPRRVVLLLQADTVLMPKRESEAATRALEEFERLIGSPPSDATLVIVAGSVDKRSRIFKLLAKQAVLVECGVLESAADAERWIRNRVAAAGAAIAPAGARLLAERCGPTSNACATTSSACCSMRWARRRSSSTTSARSSGRRRSRTTGR